MRRGQVIMKRLAEDRAARKKRLRILAIVGGIVLLAGGWLVLSSLRSDDHSGLASELAEAGGDYLEVRNQVVTAAGGTGIAPNVLMTETFEAGVIDQVAELQRRPRTQFLDAVTTVRLLDQDVEGDTAVVEIVEQTRLRAGEGAGATFSEYTLEHRLTFERVDDDWLLARDELLSCGQMPETFPGPAYVECSTPTATG